MSVLLGGYDPIKMMGNLLNQLIDKEILTRAEVEVVISGAKGPNLESTRQKVVKREVIEDENKN